MPTMPLIAATPQEDLWRSSFGDDYTGRNEGARLLPPKVSLLAKMLARMQTVGSALEFGANIGLNLVALKNILPEAELHGVEINEKACERLARIPGVKAWHGSILDYREEGVVDFAFSSALLIHIQPDKLPRAYDAIYHSSRRYIGLIEYYHHEPIEITYKGRTGILFKRDWAGDMLTRYPDLRLVDYGFVYRRDPNFPIDDVHWFLLEKVPAASGTGPRGA